MHCKEYVAIVTGQTSGRWPTQMHIRGTSRVRFKAYRLASVLTQNDRGWAGLGLSKAALFCQSLGQSRLGGAFPGIKMRSHDTNWVYGKARMFNSTPISRVVDNGLT
jgi:hypothetical protein